MRHLNTILAVQIILLGLSRAHALAVPAETSEALIIQGQITLSERANSHASAPAVRKAIEAQNARTKGMLATLHNGNDPRLIPLNVPTPLAQRWPFEKTLIMGIVLGMPFFGFIFCFLCTRYAMNARERERKASLRCSNYLEEDSKEAPLLKPKTPLKQFLAERSNALEALPMAAGESPKPAAKNAQTALAPVEQTFVSEQLSGIIKLVVGKHSIVERRRKPRRKSGLFRRPGFSGLHRGAANRRPKNFAAGKGQKRAKYRVLIPVFHVSLSNGGARQQKRKNVVRQFRFGHAANVSHGSARLQKAKFFNLAG